MPMLPLGLSLPPTMENPRDLWPGPFSNLMDRMLNCWLWRGGWRGSVQNLEVICVVVSAWSCKSYQSVKKHSFNTSIRQFWIAIWNATRLTRTQFVGIDKTWAVPFKDRSLGTWWWSRDQHACLISDDPSSNPAVAILWLKILEKTHPFPSLLVIRACACLYLISINS